MKCCYMNNSRRACRGPGAEFCLEHGNETATEGKTIFRRGEGGRTTRDRSLKPLFKFPMDITLRGNATRKFNHCIYIYTPRGHGTGEFGNILQKFVISLPSLTPCLPFLSTRFRFNQTRRERRVTTLCFVILTSIHPSIRNEKRNTVARISWERSLDIREMESISFRVSFRCEEGSIVARIPSGNRVTGIPVGAMVK